MHMYNVLVLGFAAGTVALFALAWWFGREVVLVVAVIAFVATLMLGAGSGVIAIEHRSCRVKADDLDRDYRYGLVAGCRVETSDGFVPLDNLRITNEEP